MSRFEVVPLLRAQRDLLGMPRDRTRFEAYLRLLMAGQPDPARPPLVAFNPMSREHVGACLEALLELDAEGLAARTLAEIEEDPPAIASDKTLRVGLVVVDDLKGGWTNRAATELGLRYEPGYAIQREWMTVPFWSSELPTAQLVVQEVRSTAYRAWSYLRRGPSRSLGERIALEVEVARFSRLPEAALDGEDLDYTREVIRPLLGATDVPTNVAALFGDEAARKLGMPPLGLSYRAGFALAIHEGRSLPS